MAVDMDVEPTDDEKMAGYLSTIESGEASDDESIKAKEAAVLARCSVAGGARTC